ncbi:MAG: asparagine--tRNA ligase [Parcubacteria group bacterium]|nr:MAG: asparagine--tRNA ligase [Parcubacteria group bacterium]
MTKAVFIKDLGQYVGQSVEINAWVKNFRSSGKIAFWELSDGTGQCQAILNEAELAPELWHKSKDVSLESSVKVVARVAKHPKREEYELQVSELYYYQIAADYPIAKKDHGIDFLMDIRHLWLRSKKQWAIQRVRNTLTLAIYDFMKINGFTKIDAPILTPNACEGTTELFKLKYFDETAYLSQSGQLYIEAAMFAHNRVFDFGPVFRAEKSKTRRHLTEFWMMDAEMAFTELADNLKIQEELVRFMVKNVLEKNKEELAILERDIKPLENIDKPFFKMTHAEAVSWLQKNGSKIKADDDLGAEDEGKLSLTHDNPIFVTHYPAKVKAFYMKRDPEDNNRVLCADLLAPEGYGEVIGGSQREDDYDILLKRIQEHKLPLEEFKWYLDLRKYGSVPHGGFGLGLERMVAWVCGLQHVRESIPFPRTIYRLRP